MCNPLLKWAGSKRASLKTIREYLPSGNYRLVEPFVGSAAVFLGTSYERNLLADSNCDLIDLYRDLAEYRSLFVDCTAEYFVEEFNTEEVFYGLRDVFNSVCRDTAQSSLFVYLNRHCFNGLCRYNSKGEFNVPFGRYRHPYFPRQEMVDFVRKVASCDADFACQDFRLTIAEAGRGDCLYIDPPYVPLSKTSNFTGYMGKTFTWQDQVDLLECAMAAYNRGAYVTISNHDTPETRELYKNADVIAELQVNRAINSNGAKRGKVKEILAVWS